MSHVPAILSITKASGRVHLRVLETTDLHMHIWPYDYYTDQPSVSVGLARTATLIRRLRSAAANSLLLDNGDFLQGNPMGDYLAFGEGLKEGDVHPLMAAMNTLGFDGGTLGNHDFNYGIDFLMKTLASANFPIVLANVTYAASRDGALPGTLLKPYVILDRSVVDERGNQHPIRIGIIGLVPPQIMQWDQRLLEGRVQANDMVTAARAYVPEMQEAGADIIVALAHTGIGQAEAFEGMENAAIPIAAIDGIDVLLTGHSHLEFPSQHFAQTPGVDVERGLILGKPAVMGGFWGSQLGVIDLWLRRDTGKWHITGSCSKVRSVKETEDVADDAILRATKTYHDATLSFVRRKIGETKVGLNSYFTLVGRDRALSMVAEAQHWYASRALKSSSYRGMPILSAVAPFKAGGRGGAEYYADIPAGPLALCDLANLYIYPNRLRAVVVSGLAIRNWLERAAGIFNQITPGAVNQVLRNPAFPSYDFDVIYGVTYQIDLTQPSRFDTDGKLIDPRATRIRNLCHQGTPVSDDALFVLVTNSFRVGGGGNYPGATGFPKALEAPDTNQDALVDYVAEQVTVCPEAACPWSFLPIGETSVVFETGPGALQHPVDIRKLGLEQLSDSPDDFIRFQMSL